MYYAIHADMQAVSYEELTRWEEENEDVYKRQTRERGLKSPCAQPYFSVPRVAPHAGAWIEISR